MEIHLRGGISKIQLVIAQAFGVKWLQTLSDLWRLRAFYRTLRPLYLFCYKLRSEIGNINRKECLSFLLYSKEDL